MLQKVSGQWSMSGNLLEVLRPDDSRGNLLQAARTADRGRLLLIDH